MRVSKQSAEGEGTVDFGRKPLGSVLKGHTIKRNQQRPHITRRSTMTFSVPQTTAKSLTDLVSGIYYLVKVRQRQVTATLADEIRDKWWRSLFFLSSLNAKLHLQCLPTKGTCDN